jgi:hypothetical protein
LGLVGEKLSGSTKSSGTILNSREAGPEGVRRREAPNNPLGRAIKINKLQSLSLVPHYTPCIFMTLILAKVSRLFEKHTVFS